MRTRRQPLIGWALTALLFLAGPAVAQDRGLVVFAAASLKNALDEVASAWARESGGKRRRSRMRPATRSPSRSSRARRPISSSLGRPRLDGLRPSQEPDPARHPRDARRQPSRADRAQGRERDGRSRARPRSRPRAGRRAARDGQRGRRAGRQIRQGGARKARGLGGRQGPDRPGRERRAALLLVSRGEAPLGVVYQTDAAADPNVRMGGPSREDPPPPILYPVAITREAPNPDAPAFLAYLRGPAARAAFERQG